MECRYKTISEEKSEKYTIGHRSKRWQPFLRQLLVSSGVWAVYFSMGLCIGSPTVIIPQLRREANSTEAVSDEMASWLSSIFGYSALPWVFILSALVRLIGRKNTLILTVFNTILTFVMFYCSNNAIYLLISEVMLGLTHGATTTVTLIIISEYTSPKYRGLFLTIKSASLMWGIWVSNLIGTFFHWKYIPVLGFVCSVYALTVFLWPESPYWLASKGRFDECKKAHRWLKGTDDASEQELETLISSEIKCQHQNNSISLKATLKSLKSKNFYMPLMISLLMVTQYYLSGKFVCSIYSIEIIKHITDSESTAYAGMLILDGVTVFSMYIGCLLSKVLKRRTLLFSTSTSGIIFLFSISLYLYLVKLEIILENKILSILLLSGFSLSISLGPMIMATSIYGELMPLKFKSLTVIIISVAFHSLQSTLLKISPYIFKGFGMHGTFLFFAVAASICTLAIYKYLPETKDKTLQEIEEYFKDNSETSTRLVKT